MLTVHHLDFSRSTRVLWLLEELAVEYELVRYARSVGEPAPAALKVLHPLGKSPVLVDDGFVLAESSAILRYLDARYGGGRFTPSDLLVRARHDEWLDNVEGGLAPLLFVPLAVGSGFPEQARASFAAQLEKAWAFIEDTLRIQDYLMGNEPTLADMQMSYVVAVASATGALNEHPTLEAYLGRMMKRPAMARAITAGGAMA